MSATLGASVVRAAAARRVRAPHAQRRGVLMLAVLVVLAVAALVAGGLMAASEAEHAGLTAMRFALEGRFAAAAAAILVAACIDGLDGRIARLLKATSRFGAEFR